MSDSHDTFFTSIGCMDGRGLRPVRKFGKHRFGVWYVDTITEAGLVGQVASGTNKELLESIKKKLLISIEKHHSKGVIVHGHQDCAGNPVSDEQHKKDILKTADLVRSMALGVEVIPVFIEKHSDWQVTELE